MSTQSFDPVNGTLPCEDWELIVEVLRAYVDEQESSLSALIVGDRPYNVLARIGAIADDISIYIVPTDRKETTNDG